MNWYVFDIPSSAGRQGRSHSLSVKGKSLFPTTNNPADKAVPKHRAFNRWAISVVGARGLMQIMPFWLKEIGQEGDSLFVIPTNLRFGCTILKHYLKREKGNIARALARYNGSLGSTQYSDKVLNRLAKRWFKR